MKNDIFDVSPYVKWVGGKRQLLEILEQKFPKNFENYIEPFFGGGAVFFKLQPKKAIINDANWEVINSLKIIKNNPTNLIKKLDYFVNENSEKFFYEIRKKYDFDNLGKAARFIYLNKTCFNGLYRVNKKNEFNVPFNKKKNPNLYSKANILNISKCLKINEIKIYNKDFSKILSMAQKNDFIFIDPPYDSEKNQFTSYTKNGFNREEQERLAKLLDSLTEMGIKWMLTNHPTKYIQNRYKKYNKEIIMANRMINSNAKNRSKAAKEIIITNYDN